MLAGSVEFEDYFLVLLFFHIVLVLQALGSQVLVKIIKNKLIPVAN